jgi:hypothetical protein
MSKQKTTRAKTSRSLPVFIADTSSATGGGLSGVTHSSSGLVLEYRRQNQSTWTSVTPVSKTLGTYVSGGIVADGSLAGAYEVDFPDAAFASAAGVEWVALRIRGVANMLPVLIEIELDAVDYQDAAAFGLSRIDATIGSRATQTSVDAIDDFVDTEVAAIKAKTDLIVAFPANFGNLDITVGGAIAELGVNALTANGAGDAIETYVWGALLANHTTANSFGARIIRSVNSNNTVQISGGGSNHIFAVLHDAEPNSIPEDAFVDGALSARVLASDFVAEIADGVWDEATSGHTTAGTTGKALIDSGAAGNPWSTDLATGYSGTQAGNILNEVKAKTDTITGNQTINVYPVSASTPERVAGTTLTFYRDESRSVSVATDFTLTNLTLQFTVEDQDGTDVYTLNNASINRSGQTFTIPITTAVTGGLGQYRWSMRDVTGGGNSVIAMGVLTVQEAASNG